MYKEIKFGLDMILDSDDEEEAYHKQFQEDGMIEKNMDNFM